MEIVSPILNFILGSGIVGLLIFYRSKKRKAAAEAHGAELTNSDKLIAQYEKYIDTLRAEQLDLKQEVTESRTEAREARSEAAKERDKVVGLYKELGEAQLSEQKAINALAIAEYEKCTIATCRKREPPRKTPIETELFPQP
ncbi:MAG: hypothetical protein RSB32_07555 [Mucinivorans sp.]